MGHDFLFFFFNVSLAFPSDFPSAVANYTLLSFSQENVFFMMI